MKKKYSKKILYHLLKRIETLFIEGFEDNSKPKDNGQTYYPSPICYLSEYKKSKLKIKNRKNLIETIQSIASGLILSELTEETFFNVCVELFRSNGWKLSLAKGFLRKAVCIIAEKHSFGGKISVLFTTSNRLKANLNCVKNLDAIVMKGYVTKACVISTKGITGTARKAIDESNNRVSFIGNRALLNMLKKSFI